MAKTTDALSGLIWMSKRELLEGGPTRCAHTRPANLSERSLMGAGQQASVSTNEKRERKQLSFAQILRAFLRNRLHDLASPQGHESLERTAESSELLRDGIDGMFCAAETNPDIKRYQEGPGSSFWIQVILAQGRRYGSRHGRTSSDGLDLKDA
ncbi:MAG: hypothetical protein R3B95_11060 [Nitrospirales bacterium]|nr:hypothetical protein [Nitrospirales bacterium]